jgi:hypothetical protein
MSASSSILPQGLDRSIASHFLEDELFLDTMHDEPPPFSDRVITGPHCPRASLLLYCTRKRRISEG